MEAGTAMAGRKNSRDLKAGQVIMGVVSLVSLVTGLTSCGGAVLVPLGYSLLTRS